MLRGAFLVLAQFSKDHFIPSRTFVPFLAGRAYTVKSDGSAIVG